MGFISHNFSALFVNTHIFSILRQDQSVTISEFKLQKFLIDYKMGFIFHDFSALYGNTHIFRFLARSKCRHQQIFNWATGIKPKGDRIKIEYNGRYKLTVNC